MTKTSTRTKSYQDQPIRVQVSIGGIPRRLTCFVEGDCAGQGTDARRKRMTLPGSVARGSRGTGSGDD